MRTTAGVKWFLFLMLMFLLAMIFALFVSDSFENLFDSNKKVQKYEYMDFIALFRSDNNIYSYSFQLWLPKKDKK